MDDLLSENRGRLDRLLDLYLAGDFPKDMLAKRRKQTETTIDALEKEEVGLVARLQGQTFTGDQIQNIKDFAAQVADGLRFADDDFESRQRVIEALDATVTLTIENSEKSVLG